MTKSSDFVIRFPELKVTQPAHMIPRDIEQDLNTIFLLFFNMGGLSRFFRRDITAFNGLGHAQGRRP